MKSTENQNRASLCKWDFLFAGIEYFTRMEKSSKMRTPAPRDVSEQVTNTDPAEDTFGLIRDFTCYKMNHTSNYQFLESCVKKPSNV